MKNLILLLSTFFLLVSCSQDNEKSVNSIYGTWQLIRRSANNPNASSNNWESINNGVTIIFNGDFSFESNEFTICDNSTNNGVFIINENTNTVEITINNCQNNQNGTFGRLFYFTFSDNNLILTPKELACFEGCAFLYKKII